MMNKQEFFKEVASRIKDYLPREYKDAQVSISTQTKENDVKRTGVIIRLPGEKIAPVIYLDEFFREHQEGRSVEEILSEVAGIRNRAGEKLPVEFNPDLLVSYDAVREKLQVRLYDTAANRERIEPLVHHCMGDLTACYCVLVSETEDNTMSIMVTPDLMDTWGITKKELHEDAIAADIGRGAMLFDMAGFQNMLMGLGTARNYLEERMPEPVSEEQRSFFCLTSKSRQYGAGLIISPEIQGKIARISKGNYYILPSSVHEVLIVPDEGGRGESARSFEDMVRSINAETVSPKDQLSNHVQYYDASAKKMVNAIAYEKAHRAIEAPERGLAI